MLKRSTVIIVALPMLAIATAAVWATPGEAISPAVLSQGLAQERVAVLDVRSRGEYEAAHVPGALNVPYDEVGDRLAEVRQHADGRPLVLYCRSGRRAQIAERVLERGGVGPLLHLSGQLSGWRSAGLPVASR